MEATGLPIETITTMIIYEIANTDHPTFTTLVEENKNHYLLQDSWGAEYKYYPKSGRYFKKFSWGWERLKSPYMVFRHKCQDMNGLYLSEDGSIFRYKTKKVIHEGGLKTRIVDYGRPILEKIPIGDMWHSHFLEKFNSPL